MSRFDNTINSILNRLIFEQASDQLSDQDIQELQNEIQRIETDFTQNPEESVKKAQEKIDSSDYIADAIIKNFTDAKKNIEGEVITEQTGPEWLQNSIEKSIEYVKPYLKTAGSYIDGAFEKALDALTDALVDYTPAIIKGVVGEQAYSTIRTEIEQYDDKWWYIIIALMDRTGILSWTYLAEAKKLYEENLGTEDEDIYTLNLLAATIAILPTVKGLAIFTVPFKIFRPLVGLLGGTRASRVAKAVADELKGTFNIGQKMDRASSLAARSGRISERGLNFAKKLTKPIVPVAKLTASGAKAATIISGGDIPNMVRGWMEKGKEMVSQVPQQQTLRQNIPSFQKRFTQPY